MKEAEAQEQLYFFLYTQGEHNDLNINKIKKMLI